MAALNAEVTRQASLVAYVDDFKPTMLIGLASLPLLLLSHEARHRPGPGPVPAAPAPTISQIYLRSAGAPTHQSGKLFRQKGGVAPASTCAAADSCIAA
jgi:hypothetical protein